MGEEAVEHARIHPGQVFHTMDHYVLDLRDPGSRAATYFTVYSIGYMPEVGTGHIGFLRVHDGDGRPTVDLTLAEDVEAGRRMQARLKRLVATTSTSRGIGTDFEKTPQTATFERLPFIDGRVGYRVTGGGIRVVAEWADGDDPIYVAAPRGSFHATRDITGTMLAFWSARLAVGDEAMPGEPYADDWWFRRLGRRFSSCHFSLGDTSLEPAADWW